MLDGHDLGGAGTKRRNMSWATCICDYTSRKCISGGWLRNLIYGVRHMTDCRSDAAGRCPEAANQQSKRTCIRMRTSWTDCDTTEDMYMRKYLQAYLLLCY